jgi:hypothetical protein
MGNNDKLQVDAHHYEDEANSTMKILDRIEKSQKELGKKLTKMGTNLTS